MEHYLWQLFQVDDAMERHRSDLDAAQRELRAFEANDNSSTQLYREKRREHSHALRAIKASRERIHEIQDEVDSLEPRVIRVREQTKHTHKKIVEAEATETSLTKRLRGKTGEIEALESDLRELAAAKAELEAQQSRADDANEESLLLNDTTRLDEYHRIKETVQIKTNLLRTELEAVMRQQKTDLNKVETLSHERHENEKIVAMLTEDLAVADDRVRSVRSLCGLCVWLAVFVE